jgi:hypothetical protein
MNCCATVTGADCHCAICHQTFRGMTLFDQHQDVDYTRAPNIICRDPHESRAVQDTRGVWCTPEGLAERARLTERLATARKRHDQDADSRRSHVAQTGEEPPTGVSGRGNAQIPVPQSRTGDAA